MFIAITIKKNPIEITLVHLSKKESIERDLFLVKNVSDPEPVIVPMLFW